METIYTQNAPPSTIVVKMKKDDIVLKQDFLVYDEYNISYDDPLLKRLVNQVAKGFPKQELPGEPPFDEINVTIKMVWDQNPYQSE
jgi:hypothetical protein